MNISFGGSTIKRPGAYSQVDTSNMTPVTLGSFNVLAFVGAKTEAPTGAVGQVYYFNNPTVAKTTLGEGEVLDCLNIAWGHGADLIAVVLADVTDPALAPTDSQWQTAIDLLNPEFVDGIVAVTSEAGVHTKVNDHVAYCSTIKSRRERRAFYGHATGLTVTAIKALQTALNTERGIMATPGVYVVQEGVRVLKPSYYLASAYAGLWASQAPQVPLTYKYVNFAGLERVYSAEEIESLLDSHIAPTEVVRNRGYRIVQGVTLSASTDLTKQELSVSTLKDVMSRNQREYFEDKYVGQAGVADIEVTMRNDLISMIQRFLEAGWISGYVENSAQVVKNGTAFTLEWEGKPTLPINNFLITSHFTL